MSSNNMWIVFLGAPGSGKGTLAETFAKENKFVAISTGDILRSNKGRILADGRTVGEWLSTGSLLPDEVTTEFVREAAADAHGRDVLFDGFPRNVEQAEALDEIAAISGNSIYKVIYLNVDDSVIIKRITGRFKCMSCGKIYNKFFLPTRIDGVCDVCGGTEFESRSDDNEEALKERLKVFHEKTKPLVEFYERQGKLCRVDGDSSPEDVGVAAKACIYAN